MGQGLCLLTSNTYLLIITYTVFNGDIVLLNIVLINSETSRGTLELRVGNTTRRHYAVVTRNL